MKDEITPIEVLKALPKNNCKECGFDTCLAFATSLVRRTVTIEKCPHITVTEEFRKKLSKHFSNDNIERKPGMHALTNLENKILELDFSDIPKNLISLMKNLAIKR